VQNFNVEDHIPSSLYAEKTNNLPELSPEIRAVLSGWKPFSYDCELPNYPELPDFFLIIENNYIFKGTNSLIF
jgi:hypothetical protein